MTTIIDEQVPYVGSHTETAAALAKMIIDSRSAPEYEAIASGANVNIIRSEPDKGKRILLAVATSLGNVTTTFANSGNTPTNALDDGASFAQVGAYNSGAQKASKFTSQKCIQHLTVFCTIPSNDVTEWTDTAQGAGFINFSNNAKGSDQLVGSASIYTNVAVFAEQAIQLWFLDTDDQNNSQVQVINNTGAIVCHSIVEFGENDVFYLRAQAFARYAREIVVTPRMWVMWATQSTAILSR